MRYTVIHGRLLELVSPLSTLIERSPLKGYAERGHGSHNRPHVLGPCRSAKSNYDQ